MLHSSFLTAATPRNLQGGETPMHSMGAETPRHNYGESTPSRGEDDVWQVTERDMEPSREVYSPDVMSKDSFRTDGTGTGRYDGPAGSPQYGDASVRSNQWDPSSTWRAGDSTGSLVSSVYSPGVSSVYSPGASSVYSPGASSAYSPTGAQSPYSPNTAAVGGGGGVSFTDWVEGMIVVYKRGSSQGKPAVVTEKFSEVQVNSYCVNSGCQSQ